MTEKPMLALLALILTTGVTALATDPISIKTSHNSPREMQTAQTLKQMLSKYDLSKYTFTRKVVIEERAMNHAFPHEWFPYTSCWVRNCERRLERPTSNDANRWLLVEKN